MSEVLTAARHLPPKDRTVRVAIVTVMPAQAGIRYAVESSIYTKWRGVLDHPLEPVIGRRERRSDDG
jgi:hypothetical protein